MSQSQHIETNFSDSEEDTSQNSAGEPNESPDSNEPTIYGDWKIVDLPQIQIASGEEEEKLLLHVTGVKLYRWNGEEWRDRGRGYIKVLSNGNQPARLLFRTDKVFKCFLNHLVVAKDSLCKLTKVNTAEFAWCYKAEDFSGTLAAVELFCVRFTSQEDSDLFTTVFSDACEMASKLPKAGAPLEDKDKVEE